MVFRVKDNKLYKVVVNTDERKFVELQKKYGSIEYIYVDRKQLPKLNLNINVKNIFYKLNENKEIVIDEERTIESWKKELSSRLEKFIIYNYPKTKQMSDIADKNYYELILKSKGYSLEKLLLKMYDSYSKVKDFYKVLAEFIESGSIKKDDYKAFEQIGKAMLRVDWVQKLKKEMYDAIKEVREPVWTEKPI